MDKNKWVNLERAKRERVKRERTQRERAKREQVGRNGKAGNMKRSPQTIRQAAGSLLLATGVLLLGSLILILPLWVSLSCHRGGAGTFPDCRLRGASLIGIPWRSRAIHQLAGVELNLQDFRPGFVYRTFLYTYDEEIPFATYSVSQTRARQTRETIKAFLENPEQTSLKILYRPPWQILLSAVLFAGLLLAIGAILVGV